MKLIIYVHDLFLEIGHSRALIEKINHLPEAFCQNLKSIEVFAYQCAPLDQLFKLSKNIKLSFTKVKGPPPGPFLIKAMHYHLCSYFHAQKNSDCVKLSVGMAALKADVVDIQFLHCQWPDYYFKNRKLNFISYSYKKLLFYYLALVERRVLKRSSIKILALSQFIADEINLRFRANHSKAQVAYSSVNLASFSLLEKKQAKEQLQLIHPAIKELDLLHPILLFVGAYERKGLPSLMHWLRSQKLEEIKDWQFLCVGKSENPDSFAFNLPIKVVAIDFTQKISLFYSLADAFIFPTQYEPFGLVILEALSAGPEIFVTKDQVGASELLEHHPGVHFIDTNCQIDPQLITTISFEQRQKRLLKVRELLEKHSWAKASKTLASLMNEVVL